MTLTSRLISTPSGTVTTPEASTGAAPDPSHSRVPMACPAGKGRLGTGEHLSRPEMRGMRTWPVRRLASVSDSNVDSNGHSHDPLEISPSSHLHCAIRGTLV